MVKIANQTTPRGGLAFSYSAKTLKFQIEKFLRNDLILDLDEINPFYKRYLDVYNGCSEAPFEFIFTTLLATLGSIISLNRFIIHGTKRIYPNFWVISLGKSTQVRKSTALNIGIKPVTEYQDLNNDRSVLLPARTSMSALLDALFYEKHGIIVHDEVATFLSSLGKGYNGDMKSILTSFFDVPRQYISKFISSGNHILKHPIFSIATASTTEWLKSNLKKDDVTSGFLARFLFCYKEKKTKSIPFPEKPDPEKLEELMMKCHSLYELDTNEIKYDESFKSIYSSFYIASDELLQHLSVNNGLKATLSRLQTDYFFKFCILEGTLNGRTVLNEFDAKRAVYLCTYYMAQAVKIDRVLNKSNKVTEEQKVYEIIKVSEGITKTEIHRKLNNRFPAAKLNQILDDLVAVEQIEAAIKPGKGGRDLTCFRAISA